MTAQQVVTTYLEMTSPAELRPARAEVAGFHVCEVTERDWRLNRWFYLRVGEAWGWTDKRLWSDKRWQRYVDSDALRTFVGKHNEQAAGYFELRRVASEVEIAYFGLLPEFIGMRLGGPLLTRAIELAWGWDATRAWVHTCSLDHPAALANYEARGFRVYKTTTSRRT